MLTTFSGFNLGLLGNRRGVSRDCFLDGGTIGGGWAKGVSFSTQHLLPTQVSGLFSVLFTSMVLLFVSISGFDGSSTGAAAAVINLGPQLACLRPDSIGFTTGLRRLVSIWAIVLYCRLFGDCHLLRGVSEHSFSLPFVKRPVAFFVGINARSLFPLLGVLFISFLLLPMQSIRSMINGLGVRISGPVGSLVLAELFSSINGRWSLLNFRKSFDFSLFATPFFGSN